MISLYFHFTTTELTRTQSDLNCEMQSQEDIDIQFMREAINEVTARSWRRNLTIRQTQRSTKRKFQLAVYLLKKGK